MISNHHSKVDCLQNIQLRLRFLLKDKLSAIHSPASDLQQALSYSLLAPSKNIRGLLVYATGIAVDSQAHITLDNLACAVEMLHTYSLIHDDLPAMDNDDMRRGQPACHVQFNQATAILAGNGLQNLAVQCLTQLDPSINPQLQLKLINLLMSAIGVEGMLSGQMLDLNLANLASNKQIDTQLLNSIYQLKTGKLITACINAAALTSQTTTQQQANHLTKFANNLGLAFQIQDDLLDINGQDDQIGKPTGSDAKRNLPTYPSLLGIEPANRLINQLYLEAKQALNIFGDQAEILLKLIDVIIHRNN